MNNNKNVYNFLKELKQLEKKHNLKLVVALDGNQYDGLLIENAENDYHYYVSTKKFGKNNTNNYKQFKIDYKAEFKVLEDYLYEEDCKRFEHEQKEHVAKVDCMYFNKMDTPLKDLKFPVSCEYNKEITEAHFNLINSHIHNVYGPPTDTPTEEQIKHCEELNEAYITAKAYMEEKERDYESTMAMIKKIDDMYELEDNYKKHNPNALMLEALAKANVAQTENENIKAYMAVTREHRKQFISHDYNDLKHNKEYTEYMHAMDKSIKSGFTTLPQGLTAQQIHNIFTSDVNSDVDN